MTRKPHPLRGIATASWPQTARRAGFDSEVSKRDASRRRRFHLEVFNGPCRGARFPAATAAGEMLMDHEVQISIPLDRDGFLSRQCPQCKARFKVKTRKRGSGAHAYCVHCGFGPMEEWEAWHTDEQRRYVDAVVEGHVEEMGYWLIDLAVGRTAGPCALSSPRSNAAPEPVESDEPMTVFTAACCREPVKHDGSGGSLYCIACGKCALPTGKCKDKRKRSKRKGRGGG